MKLMKERAALRAAAVEFAHSANGMLMPAEARARELEAAAVEFACALLRCNGQPVADRAAKVLERLEVPR